MKGCKKMILYPNALIENVRKIDIEFIKRNKLKALILDVDNTLIDYYKNLEQETITWAKELQGQGVKLYILSNTNKKEKVETVAEKLGKLPYKMFAKKPLKKGFIQIQKELNMKPENIGVVGDQIFTDVIGGNRCKMFTILVEPISKKDIFTTVWKRPLEEMIKNRYKKRIENQQRRK
ncbi:MAG: YqeG family HAD IIIA-type phosphatase [Clostridia bacterium]|nr:YqeG family HAD IIIA-type phosphatase [Clostridia bacterium]